MRSTRAISIWAIAAAIVIAANVVHCGVTQRNNDEAELLAKKKYAGYVNALCPPIKRGTHDFVVWSPTLSPGGGCIATSPVSDTPVTLGFEIWMGDHGSCFNSGLPDMKYFQYDCVSKWTEPSADGSRNWTYVMLKDMVVAQTLEKDAFRCSVYESTVNSKYDTGSTSFRLIISDTIDCSRLYERLINPQTWSFKLDRRRNEGLQLLLLPRETGKLLRERRDVVDNAPADTTDSMTLSSVDDSCRFPDWMQGMWTDLHVNGSTLNYARVSGIEETFIDADTEPEVSDFKKTSKRSVKLPTLEKTESTIKPSTLPPLIQSIKFPRGMTPFFSISANLLKPLFEQKSSSPKSIRAKRSADPSPGLWETIKEFFGIGVPIRQARTPPAPFETTTVPYEFRRDYAMDPAERYNKFNDHMRNKPEFADYRKKREINEPIKISQETNRLRIIEEHTHWPTRYSRDASDSDTKSNAMVQTSRAENIDKNRNRRSTNQEKIINNFQWRCVMPVNNGESKADDNSFLVYGGRSSTGHIQTVEAPNDEKVTNVKDEATLSYACLRVTNRGINVMEFTVSGAGTYKQIEDSVSSFASKLCEKKSDKEQRKEKWMIVARKLESERRPITCPILPGMVFIGKIPTPPTIDSSDLTQIPTQLCAKLVSGADDCTAGQPRSDDRMRFTVSECVDQDLPGAPPKILDTEPNEDNMYQCLAMWSETPNITGVDGKPVTFTYVFTKRLNPRLPGTEEYDCFVGTTIPNDPGMSDFNTTTMMMTTAGTGAECSRLADPFLSGMKLVGINNHEGACAPRARPPAATGGTWYPLRPQQIPQPAIVAGPPDPNAGGKWHAGAPVPVAAPPNPPPGRPPTRPPIITGRQTGGNGNRRGQHNGNRPASGTNGANHDAYLGMPVMLLSAAILLGAAGI